MPAPIVLTEYDPDWPQQFARERERIWRAVGQHLLVIEHIGSTSVPGLAAKPVIDILAGLRSLDEAPECVAPLAALGYAYVPEYEAELPERRYFHRLVDGQHTHHLHMAQTDSRFWRVQLLFRDYLRSHPETAQAYAALKWRLAEQYRHDRAAYTDAKSEFILGVLARAEAEGAA